MSLNSDYISLSPISLKAPIGWKKWKWLPTTIDSGVYLQYGKIPSSFLPSQYIWVDAEVANCVISLPWTFRDPWSQFILPASSGTLVGALTGLDLAKNVLAEPQSVSWSLSGNYVPAQIAYCIGNLFKEEVYVKIDASKLDDPANPLFAIVQEDIIYRSKFKRVHITHGEIKNVTKYVNPRTNLVTPNKFVLNIGVDNPIDSIYTFPAEKPIYIKKSDGTQIYMSVENVTKNFELIVTYVVNAAYLDASVTPSPAVGDFFIFPSDSVGLCIEDPYLIDGFWRGAESEGQSQEPMSGFNCYCTSTNSPYSEGVFTGMYLTVNDAGTPIIPPQSNTITNSTGINWQFYPFPDNYSKSETYGSSLLRYEIYEKTDSNGGVSTTSSLIPIATLDTFTNFIKLIGITSLRLEVSKGGASYRNNFHYPGLKDQYLKNNFSVYKILNQVDGVTIDVNITGVDGVKLIDSTAGILTETTYGIYNQYAWCFNEYYMDVDRNQVFYGKVNSIETISETVDGNTYRINIMTEDVNQSTLTDLPTKSYQPTYLKPKSFINRFISLHDHTENELQAFYNKGKNWKLYINYVQYNVSSFSTTITENIPTGNYIVSFVIKTISTTMLDTSLVGKNSYATFDEPFKKQGSFNGILNIDAKLGGGTSTVDTRLCLSGYWLGPQVKLNITNTTEYIGICDGRYFGANSEVATRNDLATLFISTPGGALATSSFYDKIKQRETVFYNDTYSRRITGRIADVNFRSNPKKNEIVIGNIEYRDESFSSGTEITPKPEYERIKSIEFTLPSPSDTKLPLLCGIGSQKNYYGVPISGEGKVILYDFFNNGITNPQSSDYKANDSIVSPVYIDNIKYPVKLSFSIGSSTKDGNIIISELSNSTTNGTPVILSMNDVILNYIKNNQTLEDISFFDVFLLSYGEFIILFGNNTTSFNLVNSDATTSTTTENKISLWKYTANSVFAVGSGDGGNTWGCPTQLDIANDNQYQLCLLNSVDYLTSIVDNSVLYIFSRCYTDEGNAYLGVYGMSISSIAYHKFKCTIIQSTSNPISTPMDFNFRPPALDDIILTDNTKNYLPIPNIVDDSYSWDSSKGNQDFFTRIIGANSNINANITSSEFSYEFMNVFMTSFGVMIVTFNNVLGVMALYSEDHGKFWKLSPIILAKDANSALIINGQLFYITSAGLCTKTTSEISLFNMMRIIKTGENQTDIERIQSQMDLYNSYVIYKTPIPSQKMSGYKSGDGFFKVFFYNNATALLCVQGSGSSWEVAPNF